MLQPIFFSREKKYKLFDDLIKSNRCQEYNFEKLSGLFEDKQTLNGFEKFCEFEVLISKHLIFNVYILFYFSSSYLMFFE